MLRLNPVGYYRFVQASQFESSYAGGEANVAVSLANYGMSAAFVTKVPEHEIGQCAVNAMRQFGVDTTYMYRGGSRLGVYYAEKGASQRPSKVIYDRAGSSITTAKPEEFQWDEIFRDADWFHFTGITPALGGDLPKICLDACKAANCAILGGETAEMPGMYGNDFDLVGVITGVVEKSKLITGEKIRPGHVAIGFGSSGLHTNGFSLARKILFSQCSYNVHTYLDELGETVGEALLRPHICYYPAIREAQAKNLPLDGIAHITGGGLYDNVPRILPNDVTAVFDTDVLPIPPIFKVLVEKGHVDPVEAYRVFNMGIGMVWFVPQKAADEALAIARNNGFTAGIVGEVVPGHRDVRVR